MSLRGPARFIAFAGLAAVYWTVASLFLLTAMIGTCGMGPDATCSNGGPASFVFALIGFAAVFLSITIVFFRRTSTGHR